MENFLNKYCIDLNNYERILTRVVKVGDTTIGGLNPIRIQSMTNCPISEIDKSVNQCKTLFDAGADFVRLAVPRIIDVENLNAIKKILNSENYKKPLIADVHFNPAIAIEAAKVVEKVRINPGNFIENTKYKNNEISDLEYKLELEKTHEKLLPLIKTCKEYGTALRIGSNHGSLSSRILSRYGNTVKGMVEAVLEFLDIFIDEKFYNIVVSMKASDVSTMIYACRLLNAAMIDETCIFPQHLGVTEAGEGIEARMKSACGISSLLSDGIGDTIRVSLSESPENEIAFAKKIVNRFANKQFKYYNISQNINTYNPYSKSEKYEQKKIFKNKFIIVSSNLEEEADIYYIKQKIYNFDANKLYLADYKVWKANNSQDNIFPLLKFSDSLTLKLQNDINYFIEFEKADLNKKEALELYRSNNIYPIINCDVDGAIGTIRYYYEKLGKKFNNSLIIKCSSISVDIENTIIDLSCFPAPVLVDNLCCGLWINVEKKLTDNISFTKKLLQATDTIIYEAEFISCPCCGRTSYNLEKIAKEAKEKLSHLKGLKIAIMGCIVNGPGEMADADYGCVGTQNNCVSIFKGKEPVIKNISEDQAVDELIKIIKKNNQWIEKQ